MNTLIIYQNKTKQFVLAILGFLMTLASIFVTLLGLAINQVIPTILIIGILGTIFFGYCEFIILKSLFKKQKKLVVLTKEGFYDYSSIASLEDNIVLWKDVKRVSTATEYYVSVWLKDPQSTLPKLSKTQQIFIKINTKLKNGEINISVQTAKDTTNKQLSEMMNSYLEEAR